MDRIEELRRKLDDIRDMVPGVVGFVIFTHEGFPLLNTINRTLNEVMDQDITLEEYFSAVGAGILNLASTTLDHMGITPMERLVMESEDGYVLIEKIDSDVSIMVMSDSRPSIGMVKMALRKAIDVYRGLMN